MSQTNLGTSMRALRTIWDRVNITLQIPDNGIDVGADADLPVNAVFTVDGKPFPGSIFTTETICDQASRNGKP
jgi:hypothetical protein